MSHLRPEVPHDIKISAFHSSDQSGADFSQEEGQVCVSSVVFSQQSGLTESQIPADVFPSSNCLQKDKAPVMSFLNDLNCCYYSIVCHSVSAGSDILAQGPVLWPATPERRWLPFSTLGQRCGFNYPHRDGCGVSRSHQYQGCLSSHCAASINEPAS